MSELSLISAFGELMTLRSERVVRWIGDDGAVVRSRPFAVTSVTSGLLCFNYGKDRPVTRYVFGAAVCYQAGGALRPFFELTGEKTGPDTTMRLTPGLAIEPLADRPFALFVSADLDMSGDPEVSPRAPMFRANVGFQFAFGDRPMTSRPIRTPMKRSPSPYSPFPLLKYR